MSAGEAGNGQKPGISSAMRPARAIFALVALAGLAACTTASNQAPASLAMPNVPPSIIITAVDLQGDWGLASFRNEADRPRTEAEAKVACNNPYKVTPGANGGAMMYLADQTQASEVFIKPGPGGQVFIGPQGPPAIAQDRVIISYENNVLITDWLDPSARERYGTMIFVRCGVA
jgi:hypothetical protein